MVWVEKLNHRRAVLIDDQAQSDPVVPVPERDCRLTLRRAADANARCAERAASLEFHVFRLPPLRPKSRPVCGPNR